MQIFPLVFRFAVKSTVSNLPLFLIFYWQTYCTHTHTHDKWCPWSYLAYKDNGVAKQKNMLQNTDFDDVSKLTWPLKNKKFKH